jgi:hypothetical protein
MKSRSSKFRLGSGGISRVWFPELCLSSWVDQVTTAPCGAGSLTCCNWRRAKPKVVVARLWATQDLVWLSEDLFCAYAS